MSEAKCETGWGERGPKGPPHPAAHCIRGDPPPPGEGKPVDSHVSGLEHPWHSLPMLGPDAAESSAAGVLGLAEADVFKQ